MCFQQRRRYPGSLSSWRRVPQEGMFYEGGLYDWMAVLGILDASSTNIAKLHNAAIWKYGTFLLNRTFANQLMVVKAASLSLQRTQTQL